MITKEKFYSLFILIILFIASLCYEVHLFKYYSFFQLIISGLLFLFGFMYLKYEKNKQKKLISIVNKEVYICILFICMILNTAMGNIIYGLNTFSNIFSVFIMFFTMFILFFIIPDICNKYPKVEEVIKKYYINFCLVLCAFSLLIELGNGKFGPYTFIYYRNASIFYDPNFCAMIIGGGFTLCLVNKDKKIKKILLLIIMLYVIYLTGSRGTLLSLLASVFIYVTLFSKLKIARKAIILFVFGIVSFYGINYLYSIDFFRTFQGSNNRAEMFSNVFSATLKSPIIGYGYGSIASYLQGQGFINASSHNSFLDYLFAYGYPCLIVYLFFIAKIFFKIIKSKDKKKHIYVLPMIFMIINANSILYSFGGVGLSSLLYTLILGFLNYQTFKEVEEFSNEKNINNCTNI